jgi:3-oxoacyl-(acyl-carrier-protein) synthase/acyl carrier protein
VLITSWSVNEFISQSRTFCAHVLSGRAYLETMTDDILINIHHPVVRNHQVFGQHVFPGLAYIDLIYQLFREHHQIDSDLDLRDLVIFRPLVVEHSNEVLLTIEWMETSQDTWRVTVEGQVYGWRTSEGGKQRYATVNVGRNASPPFSETVDLTAVRGSAMRVLDAEEIYANCRRRGLVHRSLMKVEGAVYIHPTAIHLDISVAQQAMAGTSDVMFHPALIDGSAVLGQSALGILDDAGRGLSLPFSFRGFQASRLLQRRCLARIPLRSVLRGQELVKASIEFFDHAGNQIGALKEITGRTIQETDWAAAKLDSLSAAGNFSPKPAPRQKTGKLPSNRPEDGGVGEFLRSLIAERLQISPEEVGRQQKFVEIGLDSVALLELAAAIETALGKRLSPTLLFEYNTLEELDQFLSNQDTVGAPQLTPGRFPADHGLTMLNVSQTMGSDICGSLHVAAMTSAKPRPNMEVAIIGLSGRFPQARTIDQLWENLRTGKDCIAEVPHDRWEHQRYVSKEKGTTGKTACEWGGFIDDVDLFDPLFFNISPHEAEMMDPQVRLFLEIVWDLFEASGYPREILETRYQGRVGVYVGAMYQHYNMLNADAAVESLLSLSSYSAIANRVSHFFRLRGPSIAVDTMCSSAATAIHLACKDVVLGECQMAIAGGVNLSIHPRKYLGLSQVELIGSDKHCRSFGQGDGYLPAETVGALLLKPLARALQDKDRILGVIKATAANHAGESSGYTVPDPNSQASVIEAVLEKAGVDARTIGCVEASANGLSVGDLVEVTALTKAFSKFSAERQFCSIGSVKSNIGHAEAASAIAQFAKVILQLQHGALAPSLKLTPLNPGLRLQETPFYLQETLQKWERPALTIDGTKQEFPRRALVNSFGAGGSYTCLLVEEHVGSERASERTATAVPAVHIAVFSAKTPERLQAVVRQLLDYVNEREDLSLADFAYTLQVRREAMESRLAMLVRSRDELIRGMELYLNGSGIPFSSLTPVPMFAGIAESAHRELTPMKRSTLEAFVVERNYQGIAELWVAGANPWEWLYQDVYPEKITLPTYPFARNRYWAGYPTVSMASAVASPAAAVEQADEASSEGTGAVSVTDIKHYIVDFLSQRLNLPEEKLQHNKNLQIYGVDSIVGIQLARALQKRFSIALPGRVLFQYPTIDAIAEHLAAKSHACYTADSIPSNNESVSDRRWPGAAPETMEQALERYKQGLLGRKELENLIQTGIVA